MTEVEGAVKIRGESPSLPPASVLAGPAPVNCQPINGGADAGRGELTEGNSQKRTGEPAASIGFYTTNYLCDCLHQHGEENRRFFRKMGNEVIGKLWGTFESARWVHLTRDFNVQAQSFFILFYRKCNFKMLICPKCFDTHERVCMLFAALDQNVLHAATFQTPTSD